MRLRTAVFLAIGVLVAAVVAAVLLAMGTTVVGGAREGLASELAKATLAIPPILTTRARQAASEARVTAAQPRLLALMATDAATIQDEVEEFRRALDAQVLYVTDPQGAVLGQVAERGAAPPALDAVMVAASARDGLPDAIWWAGAVPYEIHAQPIVQGERLLGVLVIGHAVGAAVAADLSSLLGGRALAIRGRGAVVAAMVGDGVDPAALATSARGDEVALGGKTWRVAVAAWPHALGLEVVVLGDLDAALAPAERLQRVLYVVGVAALLIALLVALVLGGALSRPVERLVGFTDRIAAGELAARASVTGVRELRQLADRMNAMAGQLAAGQQAIVDRARLADEMALATRIQTSILPREFAVPRLEIAARMDPASEVGGDYYDVLPVQGGCWIGIGDVSGHGLDAGLYALMAQTAVAAVVDARPDAAPREQIAAVNRILRANAWGRLGDVRHMTLCLARFCDDGRVTFAGAHLDLVVVRADGTATAIATPGTWVGIIDDVADVTVDGALTLAPGDTLVVYSDGVVEAAAASGEHFGLERLIASARRAASAGPAAVVAEVVAAVAAHRVSQDDDVTVVALRYRGAA